MPRVGFTSPERLQTVLDVVDYLRSSGFVIQPPARGRQTITPPDFILIRNDSGEECPAFACCQVTGTVEAGGQNYLTIDKPADTTGAAGGYLFNSIAPIADGEYGLAYDGPLVRMLTDGSTITSGDSWQPQVNEWDVVPGGDNFIAAGADDIATNVMRGFIQSAGGASKLIYATSGIPARSGITPGSATCTEYKMASGSYATNTTTLTVLNHSAVAVPSGMVLMASYEGITGTWGVEPAIVGLRLNTGNLQYTVDGTTWVTWETTTACP